jgi:hypothetical protein
VVVNTALRRRPGRPGLLATGLAALVVLAGCSSTADVAADALDTLAAVSPLPENPCPGAETFAEMTTCSVQLRLANPHGRERSEQRDAGGPAFLAELSRDDLLRYANGNDQALQLGHEVCRYVYDGRTGEVTDLLAAAGFGDADAALFVGAAGTTMCPGD